MHQQESSISEDVPKENIFDCKNDDYFYSLVLKQ